MPRAGARALAAALASAGFDDDGPAAAPAGPPEPVADDDVIPPEAIEIVSDPEPGVAVPDSVNALDGLGMADAGWADEAGGQGESAMGMDRQAGRGTGSVPGRLGGGRSDRMRRPRKCPKCNAEYEIGARECANCGAQLRGVPRRKGGAFKKILIVLVLLVVVVGGGAFAAGYLAFDSMPKGFQDLWTSMGLPRKGAAGEGKTPETGGEAGAPKEDAAGGEKPPEDYVAPVGEDVEDAPSASEDSAIGRDAGGIVKPDETPDLGGDGPAAPTVPTGGGEGGINE